MSSYPTCNREFQKNSKKIQEKLKKKKKTQSWLLFKTKQVGKGREREKIKRIVPMNSYKTRNRKLKKNSKKIEKTIKKHHYGIF